MLQTVLRLRVVRLHDVPTAFFDVTTEMASKIIVRSKAEIDKPFKVYVVRTYSKKKPRYSPEEKINNYINQ